MWAFLLASNIWDIVRKFYFGLVGRGDCNLPGSLHFSLYKRFHRILNTYTTYMRFQTYFGVPIPPFKEKKLGAGSTTIRFVVTGKIPSKKNSQQSVAIRQKARDYLKKLNAQKGHITYQDAQTAIGMCYSKMRGNAEYAHFVNANKPIIHSQMAEWSARLGPIFPIDKATLSLRFYFNNRYITDTVNKQQTVQDLLVESGVIVDDDYDTLNPIHSASACYADELIHSIAFISISFRPRKDV